MPNGHGKTTTHRLIQFALEAETQDELPYVIDSKGNEINPNKWVNGLRAKGKTNSTGRFTLTCELDGQTLIIKVDFDFDKGEFVRSYTYGAVSGTPLSGTHSNVRNLVNSRVADFMMLDGERAKQFLDGTKSSAGDAIRRIHKIDNLDILAQLCNDYHEQKLTALGGKTGDASKVKSELTILAKKTKSLGELENEKSEIELELKTLDAEVKRLQGEKNALGNKGSKYSNQIEKLVKQTEAKRESGRKKGYDALTLYREDPISLNASFGSDLQDLRNCLETNKLPESAGKEWFIELSEMKNCVCGTEIKATQKHNILTCSGNYLSGNHQTILNQIKSEIRSRVDIYEGKFEERRGELDQLLASSTKFMQEASAALQEKVQLETKNATELGIENELEVIVGKIIKAESDIEEKTNRLNDLNDGVGNQYSIDYAKNEVTKSKARLSQFRDAYEIVEKNELITGALVGLRERITAKICDDIKDRTNSRCEEIIGNQDMELESIKEHLVLKDSDQKQTGGSMGQELVLAYSFLESLYTDINFEVPFLIDSPCGPLDKTNRNQVAELLWNLKRRTIIFIINTEKAEFIPIIRNQAEAVGQKDAIKYITQFNLNAKTKQYYDKLNTHEQNLDSAYTTSEDFFDSFEAEGEESGGDE